MTIRKTFSLGYFICAAIFITIVFFGSILQAADLSLTEAEKAWIKKHPEITIAFDGDYAPYSFLDQKSEFKGIAVDFAQKMAQRAGIKLTFYSDGNWDTLYKAAQEKDVDVIATLVKRSERKKWFLFTEPYISLAQYIITHKGNVSINSREKISDKRVALVKSYSTSQFLIEEFPSVIPFYVDSLSEALEAVSNGKVEATVAAMGMASQLANQKGITNIKFAALYGQGLSEQRFGVREDWPELASILNKALDSLSGDERLKLFLNWGHQEAAKIETVKAKPPILTPEERAWLKAHPKIVLGGGNFMPLDGVNQEGRVQGIGPDYTDLIGEMLGIRFEYVSGEWAKIHELVKNKQIDGIRLLVKNADREAYLAYAGDYTRLVYGIFTLHDSKGLNSPQKLAGKTVAVLKASEEHRYLKANHPDIKLLYKPDYNAVLDAVLEGKAQAAVGTVTSLAYLAEKKLAYVIQMTATIPELEQDVHVAVRKDWPELAAMMSKAIVQIPLEKHRQIRNKWLGRIADLELKAELELTERERTFLRDHPVIRVGSDADWAPMEFLDKDGKYRGFSIDILNRIAPKLGVRFEFVRGSWQELIALAKQEELDLFSNVAQTPTRDEYLLFTKPYVTMPAGIFAKQGVAYISDITSFSDKRIAVVDGYATHDYLADQFPDLELMLVKNPEKGIRAVLDDDAFAFVDNVITTGHLLSQKGYQQIQMVGELPFEYTQRMGVRKDWPQLRDILQKALDNIPEGERNALYNQWVPLIHEKPADYSQIWKITLGALLIFAILFFWNRRLQYQVGKKTAQLASNEKRLQAIFSHRFQLTGLLSPDGKLLMANENVYNMVGADPDELIGKYLWELPHWSHSQEMQKQVQDGVKSAKKGHLINFETTHPDSEGNIHHIAFSLTPVFDNSGSLIYLVPEGTDITERKNAERALQESEQKFRSVFESSRDAITLTDEKGFVDCNAAALKMFGYPDKKEFCRHHPADVSPAVQPDGFSSLQKANTLIAKARQGQGGVFEWTHRRKDGSEFPTEILLSPMKWEGIEAVQAVIRDITERKLAEQAIRESEEKYRTFFENSCDPMLMLLDDKFFDCNAATVDLLGYESKKEFLNTAPWILSPEYQSNGKHSDEKARRMIETAYMKGTHRFEWDHKRKDGSMIPVEVSLTAIPEHGERILLVVWRDISERKKLDGELRLVKHSIEHSTDAFFWIQKDARFFYVNDAACQSLGFSRETLCTMYVSDIDPKFPVQAWPGFWEKVRTQKSLVIKSTHQKKNGEIFPVEITCNYLEFEGQEHLFAYAKNIQEKIKSEEEQNQLEKQLQQAQKMEAIGTLAGGIAHDFNNILSSVIGYTELARMDIPKESETASYIDQIFKAGQRASELVKQILAFSRKQDHELTPLKVSIVVKEALKLLRSSIPTTIEIKKNIDPNCGLVLADPTQIHQVVMNLCTNAYYAMKESGGELSIRLQPIIIGMEEDQFRTAHLDSGSYLELSISDTGCGIPNELLEKIFEPYFTTKEKGEGTGLGLATVHTIIKNSNGDMKVESRVGDGTTFFIYLPVINETKTLTNSEKGINTSYKGVEKILFVDDEKTVVDFSRIMLEGFGYRFTGFTDSKKALESLKSEPNDFDLMITDMTMPNMTGVELIQQAHKIRPDLPVILCTGYSDILNPEKLKKIGVSEYLEKPILKKDLAAKIRKVLEGY